MVVCQLYRYGMDSTSASRDLEFSENGHMETTLNGCSPRLTPFSLSVLKPAYSNIEFSNLASHMSPVEGILVSMTAEGFRDCRPGQPNHTVLKIFSPTYPRYQTRSQSEDENREFSYHPKIRDVVLTLSLV